MENIILAFQNVVTIENVSLILFGTLVGIIVGALPGLSVNMGIALLFPITFAFQGMSGILMLIGIYCGAIYGGSVSAILLNTPGTPASAATTLDGYPMAIKNGEPGRALGISTFSSVFGGLFSAACLMIVSPLLAKVALQFSAPEYFALAIFGISIITSVSSKSIIKGMMGGIFGLLISTIGIDSMTSHLRFTFGSIYLMGGISFVPVLIGLFAFSQALLTVEDAYGEEAVKYNVKLDRVFPSIADLKRIFFTVLRSSFIGTFIGAVPGTGGDIASYISYNEAKRWSKHKNEFGKGAVEGVAAPEAGNNAVSGGAFVPMLTLGIPGDGATAIILGALMVQGIQPGPLLFTEHTSKVYAIFLGLFVANAIMGILGFSSIRLFVKVVNVPKKILIPIIFTLTFVGAFAINNSLIDVFVMVFFGIAGYFLIKFDFSMSAIVIGIILGPLAESNLRRALVMSSGNISIFFTRPISLFFICVSVLSLVAPIISAFIRERRLEVDNFKA
ncbi:putative tricarboxylic transport membrane protein [Anaerovirgula multivorans]|uniref:Putative tricarboxylic transport membrane protein n=1 Tax=Anaerovirgula multivorans TaxID=312168 RepID=A0A239AXZ8_9FIRM|nr:tripartite tricarboxylate transporter permease [Anaerovirgula multivorans]SNS00221.1 putative tricarboxylic transport membrane protein [Anaerovirgula multivorans]